MNIVSRYPWGSFILVYVVMALIYALTLAMPGTLVERTVEGTGFLFPALIVGGVMASMARKKDHPRPAAAGIQGVVVVSVLIMGLFWLY